MNAGANLALASQRAVDPACNPSLLFGQKVKVESTLTAASKEWNIGSITHSLDTATAGGQWHTRFLGIYPGVFALAPSTPITP